MFDSSQIISKVSSQIQKGIWFWDGIPWTEVFRPCMAFFEYNEILSPEVFHSIHLVSLGSASELQPVQAGGPTHRPRAQQAAGTWCRISPTPTPSHRGRSGSTEGPGLWCSCPWAEMEWHLGPCSAVLLGQARKGTWGGLWQSMSCWPGADCQTIGRPQSCENRFLAFWIIFFRFFRHWKKCASIFCACSNCNDSMTSTMLRSFCAWCTTSRRVRLALFLRWLVWRMRTKSNLIDLVGNCRSSFLIVHFVRRGTVENRWHLIFSGRFQAVKFGIFFP